MYVYAVFLQHVSHIHVVQGSYILTKVSYCVQLPIVNKNRFYSYVVILEDICAVHFVSNC